MPASVKESASKILGRWSIGNGGDTMVTLWNPADEAQDFVFTLQFSGGRYHLPIHLEARATEMFNVSEVARNQFPNLISAGVTEGSAILSGVHAENEHILVAIDAGVFNVRKATCAYSCRNCNGLVGSILVADGFGVTVGGNFQMSLKDTWNTGVQHDLTNLSTWTSSHTNMATVTSSGSARGLVNGVSAGSLLITGTNDTEPWAGQLCGSPPQNCPPDTGTQGSGGGTVEPAITGVSPAQLDIGSSGTMSISGFGFSAFTGTPTVQFDGTGITTGGANVINDGDVFADYSVSSSTAAGTQNLTVSFPGSDGGAGAVSNAWPVNIVAPVPVNFRQTNVQNMGSGNLKFTYEWDSSTGNLEDLSTCSVGESVSYPGSGNFNWPSPPYDTSGNPTDNPTVGSFPGSDGGVYDNQLYPGFLKPYVSNSFTATQTFQYTCRGTTVPLIQNIPITRTVQQIQGVWTYTVSKSGSTANTTLP